MPKLNKKTGETTSFIDMDYIKEEVKIMFMCFGAWVLFIAFIVAVFVLAGAESWT